MPDYRYHTVDVFTDQVFGGNPLAVFAQADGLSGTLMQQIARELNLSETTFVLRADSADNLCKVRIFTPARELDFAGHPTLGTAHVLAQVLAEQLESSGRDGDSGTTRLRLEERVGLVEVDDSAVGFRGIEARIDRKPKPSIVGAWGGGLAGVGGV